MAFPSKWRSDQGVYFTKALFVEYAGNVYTLQNHDYKGATSLYRHYMELEDTTEFVFANQYLDGWEHWLRLQECEWFKPYVERWRTELSLLQTSRAIAVVKQIAAEPGRNQLAANKLLIELQKKSGQVGRPSAAKIKEEAAKLVSAKSDIDEDYNRLSESMVIKRMEALN